MIAGILKGTMAVATKLFVAVASEKVIEWVFFYFAESIVKSTKTPHDDAFLAQVKHTYQKK